MTVDFAASPSPEFLDKAVKLLSGHAARGGVYGPTGSASAFLIAAAMKQRSGLLLVVSPDGDSASAVASDIRFYLGEGEAPGNPLLDQVMHFPSSDMRPYASAGFETDVWTSRLATLFRLCHARAPRVVTVGLDALMRRVVPLAVFAHSSFSIGVGRELDREQLLQRLVLAGYNRAPLVEDVGDFSVRGFIIDIYPPLYQYPLRIEQTGDFVESIRFFDPATQRSRDHLPEVEVSPVHMFIPDDEALEHGLRNVLEACEELGCEKRVRQRLLDDFRHRLRVPGAENYLPYFHPALDSLLDYLPRDAVVVLPDEPTMSRGAEELEEEVALGWEAARNEGLPVPSPERLYMPREELSRRIESFRTVVVSPLELDEEDRAGIRIPCAGNQDIRSALATAKAYDAGMSGLVRRLDSWRNDGAEILLVSHTQGQASRLLKLLEPYALNVDFRGEGFDPAHLHGVPVPGIRLYVGGLSSGFRIEQAGRLVITEEEIFGPRVRATSRRRARGTFISSLTDLSEGEAVVHEDYGIGIFRGLMTKEFDGVAGEVMVIEYAGGDILYHPVERLQVIQKYVSGAEEPPRIDRLGGKGWAKTRAKVKKSLREMAGELLEIYAKRQVAGREPYSPPDENFTAFEASFAFEETPDQAKAIQDVMEAMDKDKPMDVLVCGDVGYGKTEVALRAAFRAVMDHRQVAILVPTTVLAQQHFDTFNKRFSGYPIEVDVVSRFRSSSDVKDAFTRLKEGKIDVVIGTHKLLNKNAGFRDLGLLVVDEEHRFGVAHKEKIKKYKAHVDVLTLTATPIPRTLNLSLTGIRDLSVIETPPSNRKSIRTHVVKGSDEVVRAAIVRELSRGGQVFYLHNRVRSIFRRATALKALVPEGSFGTAHGQMADSDLEKVMLDFVTGKINVLVCTNIIESGLDIPRANTIIIERADTFGLADLYQLRGRVGRSNVRAYAYLLTPPETLMTPDAVKRLSVIQEYSDLGQGFRIAMRDMEIRGAGNILGTSQSGHVAQVGYEMYLELLEEAVQEMKGETPPPRIDPEIRLKVETLIPEAYVPDPRQRMNLYKRLSRAVDGTEIDEIEDEMLDLYGKAPGQVDHLVRIMRIRLAMKEIRMLKLEYTEPNLVATFDPETPLNPGQLVAWAQGDSRHIRLLPNDRLMYRIGNGDPERRISGCQELLDNLNSILGGGSAPEVTRQPVIRRLRR
ncbi:MAG: transcription-repair coupling factor [Thermodesulfobacteriota bacterium]